MFKQCSTLSASEALIENVHSFGLGNLSIRSFDCLLSVTKNIINMNTYMYATTVRKLAKYDSAACHAAFRTSLAHFFGHVKIFLESCICSPVCSLSIICCI